ncbi:hypothetical protein BJX62DRAFT_205692 [Aspergillus germanicus]
MQACSYPRPTAEVSISATFNSFKKSSFNCRCERLKISWPYYSVAPILVFVADSRRRILTLCRFVILIDIVSICCVSIETGFHRGPNLMEDLGSPCYFS